MKVTAVVVTYGNRFNLLKQVVTRLLEECIDLIIIINNGSTSESFTKLSELANNNSVIKLFSFQKNEGSAIGFRKGIELAYNSENEFIWILDDDNVPSNGALDILKKNWN